MGGSAVEGERWGTGLGSGWSESPLGVEVACVITLRSLG